MGLINKTELTRRDHGSPIQILHVPPNGEVSPCGSAGPRYAEDDPWDK